MTVLSPSKKVELLRTLEGCRRETEEEVRRGADAELRCAEP